MRFKEERDFVRKPGPQSSFGKFERIYSSVLVKLPVLLPANKTAISVNRI